MSFIRLCTFLLFIGLPVTPLLANDLDDGIGIDEPINDNIQLNPNIDFIKRNALAKARRNTDQNSGCGGTGNQTFGPGANLQNATIVNLSDNRRANSVCIERRR
ncbi:hypothetical protein [Methylotuvimicrobium sp. KM2]|jgi:hypothetical protein|uniref:hypothetical protein n=1 Tax=Methylotuvimicrobium sp. KM2 TaxID=3133976 RepID=UPI0031013125